MMCKVSLQRSCYFYTNPWSHRVHGSEPRCSRGVSFICANKWDKNAGAENKATLCYYVYFMRPYKDVWKAESMKKIWAVSTMSAPFYCYCSTQMLKIQYIWQSSRINRTLHYVCNYHLEFNGLASTFTKFISMLKSFYAFNWTWNPSDRLLFGPSSSLCNRS